MGGWGFHLSPPFIFLSYLGRNAKEYGNEKESTKLYYFFIILLLIMT